VAEAEKTNIIITEQRESYRPVACRGSILYFVIADLAIIDPMYQYSLEFFSNLFNKRLDKSEKNEDKDKRIIAVIDDITWSFYVSICRGLFEKDKLMYSFLNTTCIFRQSGKISVDEWWFFIRGSTNDYSENKKKVDFLNDAHWTGLVGLENCHFNFKDITKSLCDESDQKIWRTI